MNLLLVDDEIVSVQGLLSGVNWSACGIEHVYVAYSAKEAKEVFDRESIDVVFLDIEMPEENGLQLLTWMRAQEKGAKMTCVFLTCHAEFSYAQDAIRLKVSDYILKPVDYKEVEVLLLKIVIGLKHQSKEALLSRYGEQWFREKVSDAKDRQKIQAGARDIVEDTKAYIMAHLSDKLSVDELAFRAHMNPDYLNRLFKKTYDISINKFIINERMQLAMELLLQGNISAYAVAQAVGYENYANFINMFKKVHHKLPSQIGDDTETI